MIEFNPYFRPSANEMLHMPVFAGVRVPTLEKCQGGGKIQLGVDAEESFDYEGCKSSKFSRECYIDLIFKEAK